MDKYFRVNETVNGYSIIKIIGEGRYGIAYLAMNNRYEKCVVKQLKKDMLKETRSKLFYEEQILQYLDNPRFPKFIARFKDDYREGYILEYMEGTVFYDLAKQGYTFRRTQIYQIASQILEIIELLQRRNIVHRDIRLPNVIIKKNNELGLIDFGLARFIDNKRYVKEMDYWYMGDFLIFLYYSAYEQTPSLEKPWYKELDLSNQELNFLKKLMGIEGSYQDIDEVKRQLEKLKNRY